MLFGLAGAAMGLVHWYAVTVLAAFVVAALLLRGRRALPVVLTGALAALPTVAMVVLNLLNGTGARNAEHLHDTGRRAARPRGDGVVRRRRAAAVPDGRPRRSLGAVRARGLRVVGAAWVLVPLLLLTVAELVRPVYLPRYLLAGLLGLGVLAAAGALATPRAARAPSAALLVGVLAARRRAARPTASRGSARTRSCACSPTCSGPASRSWRPTSARRPAWTTTSGASSRGLRPDLVLPPDDAPADADRVWLVRRLFYGEPEPTDDDAILRDGGLRMTRQYDFPATKTDLVLQLWER